MFAQRLVFTFRIMSPIDLDLQKPALTLWWQEPCPLLQNWMRAKVTLLLSDVAYETNGGLSQPAINI